MSWEFPRFLYWVCMIMQFIYTRPVGYSWHSSKDLYIRLLSMLLIFILREGFLDAVLHVLRLEPSALLTAGLPCGSFVFLNRSTSKRSSDRPLGDQKKSYVRMANLLLDWEQWKSKFKLDHWLFYSIIYTCTSMDGYELLKNIQG